jgi:uncharacterized FlaG/YvyC family protein
MIKKGVAKKTAEAVADEVTQSQQDYFNNFFTNKCARDSKKRLENKINSIKEKLKNKIGSFGKKLESKIELFKKDIIFKLGSLVVIDFAIFTAVISFTLKLVFS